MITLTNPLGLPQIVTLPDGERLRITRVDTADIVFDRLGDAPAEGEPETVLAPAQGVPGGEFADLAAVVAHLANPPAAPVDPAAAWNAFLAGSITDPVTGIRLKANRQARNDYIGHATLLREALDGGLITPEDSQEIWDADNQPHTLTVAATRALLLRYGLAWQTAFNHLAP